MGGADYDVVHAITIDAQGGVYTTGEFRGTSDFDPNQGVFNLVSANFGYHDIFISKLDFSGNFVWAKQMAAGAGHSITVDEAGNVYTAGYFVGTVDFDPNVGTYSLTAAGLDMFISKLDASGNFIWAKNMGGPGSDIVNSIAVDLAGNVYITGQFQGTADFDPNAGVFNLTSASGDDTFISKLDVSGNFVWAKSIVGGGGNDECRSIALDKAGNTYVAGHFSNTADFDPNAGIYNLSAAGGAIGFVLKLDSSGNFIWAKNWGGDINNISIDKWNNVYSTGNFGGTVDFDPNAGVYNLTGANSDIFISKLDSLGNFVWAVGMLGGPQTQNGGASIANDTLGNVYTTGSFIDTVDFDPGPGVYNLITTPAGGAGGGFVSKLDALGNFAWAKLVDGAIGVDVSIKLDQSGNIYTTGIFYDTVDFDPNAAIFNLFSAGDDDIFVQKLSPFGVGISEQTNPNINTIYPNPSNGPYTIELSAKSEITICNILGEIILTQTMEAGKQALNLQHQANGIYIVRLVSEGRQEVFKLIKQQ